LPPVFGFLASLLASIHALLNKRDSRAAALWLGFIWLLPAVGPVLYIALGVNRIRRHALSLRVGREPDDAPPKLIPEDMGEPQRLEAEHLRMLAHVVDRVAGRPLIAGNHIQALVNGDEAFPAMLAAIEAATNSVSLATYIFDNDRSGINSSKPWAALWRAAFQVRVLIDDAGARYSWPSIVGKLKRARVPVARFLPTLAPCGSHDEPPQPSQASRGRWPRWIHGRHQHPRRQRAGGQTAPNRFKTCTSKSKARSSPSCRKLLPTIGHSAPMKSSLATRGFRI